MDVVERSLPDGPGPPVNVSWQARRVSGVRGLAGRVADRAGAIVSRLQDGRLRARRAYDLWAPTYGSPPNELQRLESAARARLLPDLSGAQVLDLGCGTGRTTRDVDAAGAGAVVGCDPSWPMLARARQAVPHRPANWVMGEAERLPFRGGCFDAVVCALVLAHLPRLEPAFDEIARITRPGASLVVTDFHPCATLRGWERTFVDERTGRSHRVEQHVHLLEEYVTGLGRLGFTIDALVEPRYRGVPVVLALRARKE